MKCVVRGCVNPRHDPYYLCFAHAEHLSIKKQLIEQGPIPYVAPPKPKLKPDSPGLLRQWIDYYRTVAVARSA